MKKLCEVLAETKLFAGLAKEDFSSYCVRTSIRVAWKGEIIENEGDECNGIGVLLQGKLALQKYTSSGDFATLSLLEEGEMYGEDLLFGTITQFPVTIEAVTNSKILFIPKSVLVPLMQTSFYLNQNYVKILSEKVVSHNERIMLLSQKTLRHKIAFYIIEMYKRKIKEEKINGIKQEEGNKLLVELPVSKEVIAKLLAMPRPSFSRELINMEKDGYIKVDGRTIEILNLRELELGALEGYSDD